MFEKFGLFSFKHNVIYQFVRVCMMVRTMVVILMISAVYVTEQDY